MKPRNLPKKKPSLKRKKIFSNQNRLRADSRMASIGLNSLLTGKKEVRPEMRLGVPEERVFLKRNLRDNLRVKIINTREHSRHTKNPFKLLKTFFKSKLRGKYTSGHLSDEIVEKQDRGKISITKKRGKYYKNRREYRSILFHELVHSMHLPNELMISNSLEKYFDLVGKKTRRMSSKEIIELAIKTQELKKKFDGTNIAEYSRNGKKMSWSKIGFNFGIIAINLDKATRKKGMGLIFLREISFDNNAQKVISKISSGYFDAELREWKKMNPRLTKLLE
jgi:hypothetical protein